MATATAITAGIGGVAGTAKFFEGRNTAKEAQMAIDDFQRQDLTNAYDDVSVSTLGADYQKDTLATTTATNVNALQQSGTRGLVGGLGRVQANNNKVSQQIAADLDAQQKQLDQARAQDEVRIRNMQEQRDNQELAGYGNQLNVGNAMKWQGIGDVMNAAGTMGTAVKGGGTGTFTQAMGGGLNIPQQNINTTDAFTNTASYLNR